MIIGNGHLFGQDDVLNQRNYTTSVRCISNSGKLFVMKANDFIKSINKDKKSVVIFNKTVQDRDAITKDILRDAIKANRKYTVSSDMLND